MYPRSFLCEEAKIKQYIFSKKELFGIKFKSEILILTPDQDTDLEENVVETKSNWVTI